MLAVLLKASNSKDGPLNVQILHSYLKAQKEWFLWRPGNEPTSLVPSPSDSYAHPGHQHLI